MKWVCYNNKIVVKYRPILIDREVAYIIDRKTKEDKIVSFKTATSGMRVWQTEKGPIMEKLCIDGKMRLIKWTPNHKGDLNFYNIGWEGPRGRRYVRIDIYTGEHRIIED